MSLRMIDLLLLSNQSKVCDMRHASTIDFALRELQTSAILVEVEVEIEHSLDDYQHFGSHHPASYPSITMDRTDNAVYYTMSGVTCGISTISPIFFKFIATCLMPLATKKQNDSFRFVHELKQEMHADLKCVESIEKEIDELEYDNAEFSDMYDMILQECVSKDVMCSYLMLLSDLDALDELQCLYLHIVKECDCLAQKLSNQTESVSKEVHSELLKSFAKVEKHSISLEIALQKR
nr:hypothetical protein [Tanacetum cinerariifolium]